MLINIIEYICIGWFIVNFEPLQNLIKGQIPKFKLKEIFYCIKCCTFWTTLLLSFDFGLAATASCFAYLIFDRLLDLIPIKL